MSTNQTGMPAVDSKYSCSAFNVSQGRSKCFAVNKRSIFRIPRQCHCRCSKFRILASVQQDSEKELLGSMEGQFPFKQPKFQAFVGQTDKGRAVKAFRHTVSIEGGHLLIQPLGKKWLPQATDLLTESFADAVGYVPMYRGFLKKQVKEYLTSHINIAPKAVILEAILIEEGSETEVPRPDEEFDTVLRQTEDSVSWIDNKAASSEDDDAPTSSAKETDSPANNPFQASTAAILGETLMGSVENAALPGPPSKGEEGKLSSDVTSSGDSESSSEGSSDEGSSSEGDDPAPSLASSSGNGAEDRVDEAATRPGVSWEAEAEALSKKFRVRDSAQQTSNASTGETAAGDSAGEEAKRLPGQLIGTVELSFSASTRTKNLFLNPPEDGAYLCNMAVDEKHQRKGYGSLMLAAAEDLVEVADFRRVWLHVRLKDEPAVGLYSKASYEVEKEDCILVSLWDDRRQLLSKFIPRRKGPSAPSDAEDRDQEKQEFIAEYWQ